MRHNLSIASLIAFAIAVPASADDDPYLWLEEVESEKALAWVKEKSDADTAMLEAVPEFAQIHEKLLEIVNSRDRIPTPTIRGAVGLQLLAGRRPRARHLAPHHPRQYSRTTPVWETVLDLDALAEAEDENWVWKGAAACPRTTGCCLVSLSRGGADAAVDREFDTVARTSWRTGSSLPEAKAGVALEGRGHPVGGHRLRRGFADRLGLSPLRSRCGRAARP